MRKISAVIITKNEEANIGRCLDSLKGVVDEIIIADSFSTDKTVEIAQSKGANVISTPWSGYADTKNIANKKANNNWILSLDADEFLSDELANNIAKLKLNNDHYHYEFRRRNYYAGRLIRFGSFNPDYNIRLWNRNMGSWQGQVHEKLVFSKQCVKERISGNLNHYSYTSKEDHQERAFKYARIAATNLIQNGRKVGYCKPMSSAAYKFFHDYFLRLGILDGKAGFHIALIGSKAAYSKYQLARQKHIASDL